MLHLSLADFAQALIDPQPGAGVASPTGGGLILVDLDASDADIHAASRRLAAVLVGVGSMEHPAAHAFDVVVPDNDAAAALAEAIAKSPLAAASLALLLRSSASLDVADALVAESATYSLLQAGPEHQAWLKTRPAGAPSADDAPRVRITRAVGALRLTLNRPAVRNAFDAATRDALLDGLAVATADPSITRVVVDGEGPGFCSGGDLNEFGTFVDVASAHLLRVTRSVGRAVHDLDDRVTFVVHGPCVGAGIELAAFAGRVVARADATFRLPEVSMGLVPGAGGTVSIPRRVGRQRANWLALTGEAIDAPTALDWGLVDEISDSDTDL